MIKSYTIVRVHRVDSSSGKWKEGDDEMVEWFKRR